MGRFSKAEGKKNLLQLPLALHPCFHSPGQGAEFAEPMNYLRLGRGRETVCFTLIALLSKPRLLAHLCCYWDVQILDLILKSSKGFQLPLSLTRDKRPQHFPYVFKVKDLSNQTVPEQPGNSAHKATTEGIILSSFVGFGNSWPVVSTKAKPQLTSNNYQFSS